MQIFQRLDDSAVVTLLKQGKVGIIPTDTVYGIVCAASDESAVARLYALKHRHHKPGTLIAADIDQLVSLGIKERYLKAVAQFWPGAVSIEIPHGISYLNQNTGRQAIRVPANQDMLQLLRGTGPLQTTSANPPDEPTAVNMAEAMAYFGESVDFYVDGGDLSGNPPSTIIRIIDDAIEVVRQGAVHIDESGRITPS